MTLFPNSELIFVLEKRGIRRLTVWKARIVSSSSLPLTLTASPAIWGKNTYTRLHKLRLRFTTREQQLMRIHQGEGSSYQCYLMRREKNVRFFIFISLMIVLTILIISIISIIFLIISNIFFIISLIRIIFCSYSQFL